MSSPTPLPTIDPAIVDTVTEGIEAAAVGFVVVLVLAFVFVWAILRAARYESPASLVVALSLLTFLSLAGAIASGSTELTTLAATGIGALAGAVSAQFTDRNGRPDE